MKLSSLKRSKGQGMVEYILIIALIAVLVIAGVKIFGKNVNTLFSDSADKIKTEGNAAIK